MTTIDVEPGRKEIYDRIHATFESEGIRPDLFYGNRSYFRHDAAGVAVPLKGSHPTLVHWPLEQYVGGPQLMTALQVRARELDEIVRDASILWIDSAHWHCTAFSPIHSSDPDVIASAETDVAEVVRRELASVAPYELVFSRILLTRDCGIKAVGYAIGPELDCLRLRLREAMPGGSAPNLVHISMGNFVRRPPAESIPGLVAFARGFLGDQIALGRLTVDSLTYAIYHGPFIRMTVERVFSTSLHGGTQAQDTG